MKPVIGVVGRVDYGSDKERVICIWEEIQRAIVKKGGLPILLLPLKEMNSISKDEDFTLEEKEDIKDILSYCDGILLQGGYNWYNFDEVYYQQAYHSNMPILGICLGMQMMAKIDCKIKGLEEDGTKFNEGNINHYQRHQKYAHVVQIEENTLLKEIVKQDQIPVNSRHRYHIRKIENLKVSAKSQDGIIEAIEACDKDFVLGVQWHPESILDEDKSASLIFERFIEAAKNYHLKSKK